MNGAQVAAVDETCFTLLVRRLARNAGLSLFCVGCSNVLGADFDATDDEVHLSVARPEHPKEKQDPEFPMTGAGRVVSDDAAIDCGLDCGAEYLASLGKTVTLTAHPDPGSAFAGWRSTPATACENSRAPSCSITPGADLEIEAYFVRNGANLWGLGITGDQLDFGIGIVVDEGLQSYAVGAFQGPLAVPGDPIFNEGDSDVFVLKLDPQGEIQQVRTVGSLNPDQVSGIALSTAGPILIGGSDGETSKLGALLYPLGDSTEPNRDAFIVAYAGSNNMGVRWHHLAEGVGNQSFEYITVADDDNTYVLGTMTDEMSFKDAATVAIDDLDMVLVGFEPDGTVAVLENLGGDSPLGIASIHGSDDIVIAGYPLDVTGVLSGCSGKASKSSYVARISPKSGACRALVEFPPDFVGQIQTDGDNHVLIAGRLQGVLDLDPNDPKAHVESDAEGTNVIVSLDSNLSWVSGESWVQVLYGSAKLGALGTGRGVLVSMSMTSDTFVGTEKATVLYETQHGFVLIQLDSQGQLEWTRTFGAVNASAAKQITWHAPSSTWFIASQADADQDLSLDLENVTQSPIPLRNAEALFGRFAP